MSMSLIKQLHEQRTKDALDQRSIVDAAETEKRTELNTEEETRFQSLDESIVKADKRIADLLAVEEREAKAAESRTRIEGLVRPDPAEQRQQEGKTDLRSFLKGETGERRMDVGFVTGGKSIDFRALGRLSAAAGDNLVEKGFYNRLIAHLIEVSGVLQAGPTVLMTDSGEDLQIPKTTAHSVATRTAEGAVIPTSEPTFGQAVLKAYKYSLLMQVDRELIDDASVDLEGYLAMQAGRAVGNAIGNDAINGTGASQPRGILLDSTAGVTGAAGVVGAFTADNLVDLYFSVIAPYRNSPSCGWLLKDQSLATVRKFKGSDGQYIWQPSYKVGEPDTILGKAVYTDPYVPAVALSAKSVIFGDMSQVFARMVNKLRFERSDDYAFNTDVVTYRCIQRSDTVLVDQTGAVKYFQGNAA